MMIVLLALLLLTVTPSAVAAPTNCVPCHEVQQEAMAEATHGFLDCADCHLDREEVPHSDDVRRVDCALCHDETVREYAASDHGRSFESGATEAPDCSACHGPPHELMSSSDADSPTHPRNLPGTCGRCHANPEIGTKFGIPFAQPIEAYAASVHAQALGKGQDAAVCADCHGSHGVFSASDPRSPVYHQRVPETCGACHSDIAHDYRQSVHGRAAANGASEAPVCTDCHGEHRILSPGQPESPVFATNIPKMTCGRCHGDLRLAEKFGLSADKLTAYDESYHGLATRSGVTTVAHCASCHGVHDIQPSSDPRSHVHADNLAETCGKCHPGAGDAFAIGTVHILPSEREHTVVYYVRGLYLWLIFLTVGGMVVHNALDFYRKLRTRPARSSEILVPAEERMSVGFRLAHAAVALGFMVLVVTGFALKYPESWWARPLLQWEASLELRGLIHRLAAVGMLAGVAFHAVHLVVDRRARACIAGMRPGLRDWREFRERVRYFLGRRPDPPHTARLGYAEKIEYLALMWGIGVMAVTGILLWGETWTLRWLPTWVIDLATVVHFYEAILATLAILVWHLYFVIFDPEVYPMDTAWLTGCSPEARNRERHPAGK